MNINKTPKTILRGMGKAKRYTPLQAIKAVGFNNPSEQQLIKVLTMPYFLLDDAQSRYREYMARYPMRQQEKQYAKRIAALFLKVNRDVACVLNLNDIVKLYDWADDAQQYYNNEIEILKQTTRNLYANFEDVTARDKVCDLLVIEVCVRIAKCFAEAHQDFKADANVYTLHQALVDFTTYESGKGAKTIKYNKVFFDMFGQAVNNLINKFTRYLGEKAKEEK